jgi:hypothetical protein
MVLVYNNFGNVGRPLVGLLTGNEDFSFLLPWRPTRGLPTFSYNSTKNIKQ